MEKVKLEKLQSKYQAQADKNYQMYQETGITRYDTARRNAEDLADALLIAVNAIEEHNSLTHLRAELASMAAEAARLPYAPEEQRETKMKGIIDTLISVARMAGLLETVKNG